MVSPGMMENFTLSVMEIGHYNRINDTTGDTITFVFGVKNGNTLIAEHTDEGFDLWVPDSDSNVLWKVDQNRSAPVSINDQLDYTMGHSTERCREHSSSQTQKATPSLEVSESGVANSISNRLKVSPTGMARHDDYIYTSQMVEVPEEE